MPDQQERMAGPKAGEADAWRTIGAALEPQRTELLRIAARLRPLSAGMAAARVDKVLEDLDKATCRIAVVGQVKAGKSSLVNALIRRPGLSPVSVNPWTAVVSKLHFGRPDAHGARAVFRFFDEADWAELTGGGRRRALAERLGLPLEQEAPSTDMERMRQRAERRLGRLFNHLLGREHRYAGVSAEVIARYVCMGDQTATAAGHDAPMTGRFADITKCADLHFDLPPFAMPTTVIDTPGINDPFLVRDDLTREALEGADVYVLVLTAQQALSATDLAMLRLLHGLHKDRVVVFVNRIDMLSEVARDKDRVVDHVRAKLGEAFPGVAIPVVAGSALWAELALNRRGSGEAAPLPPALTGLARKQGWSVAGDAAQADMVAKASGLPALEATISDLLGEGPAMHRLGSARGVLRAVLNGIETAARNDERTLAEGITLAAGDRASKAERLAVIERELLALEAPPASLDGMVLGFAETLEEVAGDGLSRLRFALASVVENFAEEECRQVHGAVGERRVRAVWYCDAGEVRRELEATFLQVVEEAAGALPRLEQSAVERLRRRVSPCLPDERIEFAASSAPVIDPTPSISALSQTVAIDVGDQWARWWQIWRSGGQQMRRLKEVVVDAFLPVVDALIDAAEAEFEQEIAAALDRFTLLHDSVAAALAQRRDLLLGLRRSIEAEPDGVPSGALVQRYRVRRRQQQERLEACRAIDQDLRRLEGPAPTDVEELPAGEDARRPAANDGWASSLSDFEP
jgi:GTP-binding protein EngB required for normal cell division